MDDRPTSMSRRLGNPQVLAVICLVLGVVLTLGGISSESRIRTLARSGVEVTYTISSCSYNSHGGIACTGGFEFRGHHYGEPISGLTIAVHGGTRLRALVDPSQPAAYVYARSAVLGRGATKVSSETVSGLALLVVSSVSAYVAWRRRKVRRAKAAPIAWQDLDRPHA